MGGKRTEISELGEFGLIKRIRDIVTFRVDNGFVHDNLLLGISDDAAVYKPTPGKVQLITTDAIVEGIHFDLTFTSMMHLGWKAMAANLSDIAAMGGVPRYAAVTISLPKKISLEMIEEFYRGAAAACKQYSCLIVGGDTTTSHANMMVSITLTGEADEKRVVYRKGAQPGDYICVTGHLGASVAGLKILQREKKRFLENSAEQTFQPNLEPYKQVLEKHLMPKPRLDISRILTEQVSVHSMIDISDGLASEVHHICEAGNVGAIVFEHSLPVEHFTQHVAEELSEKVTDYALFGGEEYELLFALSEEEYKKLEHITGDITIIGRIQDKEKGIELVREQGESEMLPFAGWSHFAS